MLDKKQILENARKTLELESKAIHDVIATLDDEFASTVEYLSNFEDDSGMRYSKYNLEFFGLCKKCKVK